MFSYQIMAKDGDARTGRITTSRGIIETPAFVPVGTLGTVRALSNDDLLGIGTQVIIANTYHLHLQPGEDLIERMGGLHRFMGWKGPLMTDSGGFQIFSLGAAREHGVGKIASIFPGKDPEGRLNPAKSRPSVNLDETGAEFISYLDGSRHQFTPEGVIDIQRKLGADIILVLDECTSPLHDALYTKQAMQRTHRWAIRALEQFHKGGTADQALFGVVQGGAYEDLRKESALFMAGQTFDGFAIGGSLGKSKEDMKEVLEWTTTLLPDDKPRHLLGIGTVEDLFAIVTRGIDLFDCIAPTLMARTGTFFVKEATGFRIHIRNNRFKEDAMPVEKTCACTTCALYTRAYLRHLFMAGEPLGVRLAAIHNLAFMEGLMGRIRQAIKEKRLETLKREWMG